MNKYSTLFRRTTSHTIHQPVTQPRTTTFDDSPLATAQSDSPSQLTYNFEFLANSPSSQSQALSRENVRVAEQSQRLVKLASRSQRLVRDQFPAFPSAEDLTRLLQSLDAVTVFRNRLTTQLDSQQISQIQVSLKKSTIQCFTIMTKSEPVPLTVNIDKQEGTVRCCISKTVAEPSELCADLVSDQDCFTISDSKRVFTHSQIYLSLVALSNFKGSISIHFGVSQVATACSKQGPSSATLPSTPTKTLKKASTAKNFIQFNLDPVPLNSTTRQGFHTAKCQDWAARRSRALAKKRQGLQDRRERAIFWLRKQELSRQREKLKREERNQFKLSQERQRQWIYLLHLVQALTTLKTVSAAGGASSLTRLRRSNSIRRIQTRYKQLGKCTSQITLTRASNLLQCYRSVNVDLMGESSEKQLVRFTKDSFFHIAFEKKLEHLTRCVICIQETWRNAMKKTKERLFVLGIQWNQVLNKMNSDKTKVTANRQQKKRHKELQINLEVKNAVLMEYLLSRKRKYRRIIQWAMMGSVLEDKTARPKLWTKKSSSSLQERLPSFSFLPTDRKMRELIFSALYFK